MADEKSSGRQELVVGGPTAAEILEFARRSKVINLDVNVGTLLEHLSIVESRIASVGPGAAAGWGIVSRDFGIVCGATGTFGER